MTLGLLVGATTFYTWTLLATLQSRLNSIRDPLLEMSEVQAHFLVAHGLTDNDVHEGADLVGKSASERVVDVVAFVHGGVDGGVGEVAIVAVVIDDDHGDGFGSHCG
jgi:hypothetical protein